MLLIILIDFPFVALKPLLKDLHQGIFPKFPLLPLPHHVSQSLDFKIGSRYDFQAPVLQLKQSPFVLVSVDSAQPHPSLSLLAKKAGGPLTPWDFQKPKHVIKPAKDHRAVQRGMELSKLMLSPGNGALWVVSGDCGLKGPTGQTSFVLGTCFPLLSFQSACPGPDPLGFLLMPALACSLQLIWDERLE